MNKRQKRKWSRVARLENKVAQLTAENFLLSESLKDKHSRLIALEQKMSDLETDTEQRFATLESENKRVSIALENAIIKFNQSKKKSWFGKH